MKFNHTEERDLPQDLASGRTAGQERSPCSSVLPIRRNYPAAQTYAIWPSDSETRSDVVEREIEREIAERERENIDVIILGV